MDLKKLGLSAFLCLAMCIFTCNIYGQGTINGTVTDDNTGETLIGATVILKGTTTGTTSDIDGNFSLEVNQNPPLTLVVNFLGYIAKDVTVNSFSEKVKVSLSTDNVMINEVEVVGKRISEKQQQAPLTTETMDVIAVKQVAAGSFYEGLANMKGVDMTSASLGFKVINTRGFNSTSPVRSLQLIDGIDNQSPGLNFSLGNFLGTSDLDVMKVDVISGASSAFYGPGAFNGVIDITSKNPFLFPGLSVQVKAGERNLYEGAFRWAQVLKNKEGKDKFAYKINFFYLTADDWEADDYSPAYDSDVSANNPGGFDAVNIYGDEQFVATNYDYSRPSDQLESPGLGKFFRTGYREEQLVDYDLENLKFNTALFYKLEPDLELSYDFRYSTGTTVYQGDNRYRLKNIQFFQNHLEIRKKDKFFFRVYATNEDAGDTYDIVQTGFLLNKASGNDRTWNTRYSQSWNQNYSDRVENLPGYPEFNFSENGPPANWAENYLNPFLAMYQDSLQLYHNLNREMVDNTDATFIDPRYEPGTARFDSLFNDITSRTFAENGSRFFDKSALYHAHGEYKIESDFLGLITVGADGRLYTPDSRGTIFSDTLTYDRRINDAGEVVLTDSSYKKITNYQFGAYLGIEKKFIDETLTANATLRMDKNENFDPVLSPALSLVYTPEINHTFRATLTSAVRNPTMADQFLFYDVGRAILLGNVDGRFEPGKDSLITVDSFNNYRQRLNTDTLEYFNIDAIKPEKVQTFELGYRATLFNSLYIDLSYYYSIYKDFLGYQIGVQTQISPITGLPVGGVQPYRVSANAREKVTTQGFSMGFNYYFEKFTFNGNYSFNKLITGSNDPIIPAYNTPENKFNIGLSGRDLRIGKINGFSFNINYKWIQGFLFEGSPQFTGFIESYDMVDAQISYELKLKNLKKTTCRFKLGASNLLNNKVFQVYGGPTIGRLAYFSILFEINNR